MGTSEKSRWAETVFTFLMKKAVDPAFRFPGGGLAVRAIEDCLESLDEGTGKLSREKVTDFCVCQVYTITIFDKDYMKRWKVNHSFGRKALDRFASNSRSRRYYEDKWLASLGLSRLELLDLVRDRSRHPLSKFIYPDYEDLTKVRVRSTEAGLYICSVSTLMWTPFSEVCRNCDMNGPCREMTRQRYPELYRIREEEYRKGGDK